MDLIDIYLKPKIDNIKQILLEEDQQDGSIGECMEYVQRKNVFMEMVAMAQTDMPHGMFTICLDFMIVMAKQIRNMDIIYNDKVHKSLLQMSKCIHANIKNDIIEINDMDETSMYVRTILDFMNMITDLVLNRNTQISKFFIEEQSMLQKTHGTQTYIPIIIILEFLKKETLTQGPVYQHMLRQVLIDQLKIQNPKVRRFIIFESDFALNITSKLSMYLQIIPEEVQLIRNNYEQFPDDDTMIYQSGLHLKRQMGLNYSKNILDSFRAFDNYIKIISRLCEISECSQVEY